MAQWLPSVNPSEASWITMKEAKLRRVSKKSWDKKIRNPMQSIVGMATIRCHQPKCSQTAKMCRKRRRTWRRSDRKRVFRLCVYDGFIVFVYIISCLFKIIVFIKNSFTCLSFTCSLLPWCVSLFIFRRLLGEATRTQIYFNKVSLAGILFISISDPDWTSFFGGWRRSGHDKHTSFKHLVWDGMVF